MTKRVLAAALFLLSGRLDRASKWCAAKSMRLMGFNFGSPPPLPTDVEIAAGCLDCGSMFAVKAEFEAHQCPRKL